MKIAPFLVEEWMNAYETKATYNLAETCVDSVSLDELFALTGTEKEAFFAPFCARRLTYGDIEGMPALKEGVCALYKTLSPGEVVTTHGAAGANHHVFYSLIEPGDRVISVSPTYQQLYSIPASFGADVQLLHLRAEDGFRIDLAQLKKMAVPGTKMICINNPNNPSGALMDEEALRGVVEIARACGAYVLCDEVYRHLTQEDVYVPSIADLYEKGISVSSMSKVFSLAGLRMGWIATHDADVLRACMSHRDYNLISCGMFDEAVAALALKNKDALLARSRGIVRRNLALLDAFVQKTPQVHYVKPQAGTTALLYYDYDMPSYEMCTRLLQETGVFMTPGDCFGLEKCARIGYACDEKELQAGLEKMSAWLDALK